MGFKLVVISALFLPGSSDGAFVWATQDIIYHEQRFESREACERYKERRGEDIANYLEDQLRDFWTDALRLDREEVLLRSKAECNERSS